MTTPLEEEDKYGRFFRYFDIDIKAIEEAALGAEGGLSNYYTKAEVYNKTEIDTKLAEITGQDLSNYYTKTETNSLLSGKADSNALSNYIPLTQKDANGGVPSLDNNGRVAPERLGANATASSFLRGDKTWVTLDKSTVGLSNVDNTSDANKPVSAAQQTALNAKADISNTPRYLAWSGTAWPARPADSRMTFWIGGSASTDTPTGAVAGDVWIPAS